jgi:hypothetical protein
LILCGFRPVIKFGEKGVIDLGKMVFLVGGVLGGIVGVCASNMIINNAKNEFYYTLSHHFDYYNSRCIKTNLKGLPPAIHRQQALMAA